MSSAVKRLEVTYNPINDRNTFTNGDFVTGQVTVEVSKDCQINSLFIKFKGKADVLWSERHGQTTVVYHSKDKYFSVRHYFIGNNDSSEGKALYRSVYESLCCCVTGGGWGLKQLQLFSSFSFSSCCCCSVG